MANTKITNHIVDKTLITGQTAVTAADGDYILVADASDSSALKKVLASDLIQTSEEVADIVGAMVSSNTESGITVAYQDSDNTIDFTIGTLNQNTTGSAATLTTARTIGGTSFNGSANIAVGLAATATALATSRTIHGVGFDGSANIDLSEVISDTVGAMFSSNTETNITATYQDADNTIDLVVDAAQPNVTSLGTLTTLRVDDVVINGTTIGHADDTDLITVADGVVTVAGELDATTLDISGAIDVAGTSNLDVVDIDGAVDMATTLQVDGVATLDQLQVPQYVTHAGDTHTYMEFRPDLVDLRAGNVKGITIIPAEVVINEDSADLDFRVEGNGFANLIFANAGTDRVGIGTASPSALLDVQGNVSAAGSVTAVQSAKITQQPLATSGTTISWNSATKANAYLVPSANLTIDNPSNSVEGAIISVEIAMDGTPRTIAWHANFEFASSTTPVATATANKTDIFAFRYNGSQWQEIGRSQNMAQT